MSVGYGQSLPDQVTRISELFDVHLEVIGDIGHLYRERAVLERDYAAKLQLLARKASEKKAKLEAALVIGTDPTKGWNDSTLKQNTLNAAFDHIVDGTINTAQDHVTLAEVLTSQVADVLRGIGRKSEETKKKELAFFQKLVNDRDRTNNERQKTKIKYDEECGVVDSYRQKQSRSHDDRHADRVAKQAEQQKNDMLNSKNVYILSTVVANRAKNKFYNEDLPALEDEFQILQTRLVNRFTKVLLHAQTLQHSHYDTIKRRLSSIESALAAVSSAKDQALFIEYNIRPFVAPDDWLFEPCAGFYDTDEISTEPAPKVFLQNKASKSHGKLEELGPILDGKRRECESQKRAVEAYTPDRAIGTIDDVSDAYLDAVHHIAHLASSEAILKSEVETILAALGGDVGQQQQHSFKSSSFSIPTTCGYCKTSIWGLSKQGKTCKSCGISVHSKCELKVPADCSGGRASTLNASVLRSGSVSTLAPRNVVPPTPSSFVHGPEDEQDQEEHYATARVIFNFTATSEFELNVKEGAIVYVLEHDDGSGWVKVRDGQDDGLVPASYLAHGETTTAGTGPAGQTVTAVYAYSAQGDDEIGFADGESITLTPGPNGGKNYADGWWEGTNARGETGIFPSNYVQ